jgi:hypothetical protein
MPRTRTLLLTLAAQVLALGALAQSVTEPSAIEFGRASGGTIHAIAKAPRQLSGSLSLTQSTGARSGRGYDATLGGELLDERVWFFGTASILPQMRVFNPQIRAIEAKTAAQPVDWTAVTASFLSLRR